MSIHYEYGRRNVSDFFLLAKIIGLGNVNLLDGKKISAILFQFMVH